MDAAEMDYSVKPREGLGPLHFGMPRREVRQVLGAGWEEFLKSPFDDVPTDAWDELGLHVYYDGEDRLEAVETFRPARPTWQGEDLLSVSYRRLRHLLRQGDRRLEVEAGEGLTSYRLGVGAHAPDGEDEPEAPVEGVIVFRRGYYED